MTAVKICGITTAQALDAAVAAGAAYLGFVFYPASPRHIDAQTARVLTNKTPSNLCNVGLFVNPKPADIARILDHADLDMIQLHGDETPQDIGKIKAAFGLPVMKALRIGSESDLDPVPSYEKACDWLLFDARADEAPGGTGRSFDWSLLRGRAFAKPWMLAGGLSAANIGAALSALRPDAVDVSSGVEDAPGVKNPQKIKEFIEATQQSG